MSKIIEILNVQYIFSYWIYWEGGGCKHPETSQALYSRSWELSVSSGLARLNTRMSADVHVIPACYGSAASTDFPLFVHRHNCADVYIHRFVQHLRQKCTWNVSSTDLILRCTIRDIRDIQESMTFWR